MTNTPQYTEAARKAQKAVKNNPNTSKIRMMMVGQTQPEFVLFHGHEPSSPLCYAHDINACFEDGLQFVAVADEPHNGNCTPCPQIQVIFSKTLACLLAQKI